MSRWLVAGVLLGCWGCAFTLDGPDPNRPRNRVPVCDTSKGIVALDGVVATVMGVAALSIASEEPAAALIPLGIGALYLGGAVSGNRAVNKCREAIADYEGSYNEEYADSSPGRLIPRPRTSRPSDPYTGAPTYPPPPQTTYTEPPTYPPPQPGRTQPQPQRPPQPQQQRPEPPQPQQPPAQESPVPQVPAQQPPAKQPRQPAPPPPSSDDDWSDFWREVP